MSGLEIAGIVIGCLALFPEASKTVKACRARLQVATSANVGLAYYSGWETELDIQSLFYKQSCERIFMLAHDHETRQRLLANPEAADWRDFPVNELQERLGSSYAICIQCFESIDKALRELVDAVQRHEEDVQGALSGQRGILDRIKRVRHALTYRRDDDTRQALFQKLKSNNDNIRQLLNSYAISEVLARSTEVVQSRGSMRNLTAVDRALCRFCEQATVLFWAVARASGCGCDDNHLARLLLEHRNSKKAEFAVMFTASGSTRWAVRRTKIKQGDMSESRAEVPDLNSLAPQAPRQIRTLPQQCGVRFKEPGPSFRWTLDAPPEGDQDRLRTRITILCKSLEEPGQACWGYLNCDESSPKYYVYPLGPDSQDTDSSQPSQFVGLNEIIGMEKRPMPSLRARYFLAMTLASSFVQLLESPWLQGYITKESVVFAKRLGQAGGLALDEPHILQDFSAMAVVAESLPAGSSTVKRTTSSSSLKAALKHFGILLLEIITWDLFENQNWGEGTPQGPARPQIGERGGCEENDGCGKAPFGCLDCGAQVD